MTTAVDGWYWQTVNVTFVNPRQPPKVSFQIQILLGFHNELNRCTVVQVPSHRYYVKKVTEIKGESSFLLVSKMARCLSGLVLLRGKKRNRHTWFIIVH